jgi:hypothetical protein
MDEKERPSPDAGNAAIGPMRLASDDQHARSWVKKQWSKL